MTDTPRIAMARGMIQREALEGGWLQRVRVLEGFLLLRR
jgi:hypothetical protein